MRGQEEGPKVPRKRGDRARQRDDRERGRQSSSVTSWCVIGHVPVSFSGGPTGEHPRRARREHRTGQRPPHRQVLRRETKHRGRGISRIVPGPSRIKRAIARRPECAGPWQPSSACWTGWSRSSGTAHGSRASHSVWPTPAPSATSCASSTWPWDRCSRPESGALADGFARLQGLEGYEKAVTNRLFEPIVAMFRRRAEEVRSDLEALIASLQPSGNRTSPMGARTRGRFVAGVSSDTIPLPGRSSPSPADRVGASGGRLWSRRKPCRSHFTKRAWEPICGSWTE